MVEERFGGRDASVGAADGLLALATLHAAAIHVGGRITGGGRLTTA